MNVTWHHQHAGSCWKLRNYLRYHTNVPPVRNNLLEYIAFRYASGFQVGNGKESMIGRILKMYSVEAGQEVENYEGRLESEKGEDRG